jgi:hypothetical protein
MEDGESTTGADVVLYVGEEDINIVGDAVGPVGVVLFDVVKKPGDAVASVGVNVEELDVGLVRS